MTEQEIIKIIRSNFSKETIFQLTQIKNFIDSSLKDFACKTFNKEEEKIRYLIESLHNIKDFTVVVTVATTCATTFAIVVATPVVIAVAIPVAIGAAAVARSHCIDPFALDFRILRPIASCARVRVLYAPVLFLVLLSRAGLACLFLFC